MKEVVVRPPLGDDTPSARLLYGADVRESLRLLEAESIHCAATSPPYWGLRDYGTGDQQIGQESTPDEYVQNLVEVFREVHRVLRPDGTLWLNLGDSYAANRTYQAGGGRGSRVPKGLKPKDLVGIPWRVALALQEEGWWLRNAIIWHKANHMPSPVQDRFTCSYEFIFLFSKSERYFFDLDAVRVPHTFGTYNEEGDFEPSQQWFESGDGSRKMDQTEGQLGTFAGPPRRFGRGLFNPGGKNPGDVWLYPTQPFPGAHFAVWPPTIPERIIRAATSEHGCCSKCGAPWELVKQYGARDDNGASSGIAPELKARATRAKDPSGQGGNVLASRPVLGTSWEPTCKCDPQKHPVTRCKVLDPFSGSGTTGYVALRLNRDYVGIDLNETYLDMAVARVRDDPQPVQVTPPAEGSALDIFGGD